MGLYLIKLEVNIVSNRTIEVERYERKDSSKRI